MVDKRRLFDLSCFSRVYYLASRLSVVAIVVGVAGDEIFVPRRSGRQSAFDSPGGCYSHFGSDPGVP